MGRATDLTYPPPVSGVGASESFEYDPVGRLAKYTNRGNADHTFSYDARNRLISSIWE